MSGSPPFCSGRGPAADRPVQNAGALRMLPSGTGRWVEAGPIGSQDLVEGESHGTWTASATQPERRSGTAPNRHRCRAAVGPGNRTTDMKQLGLVEGADEMLCLSEAGRERYARLPDA